MVHRIDGFGATAEGLFTNGDPVAGVPYTWMTADWCNMVQGEMEAVVLHAGLVPTKGNNGQLLSALELLGVSAASNLATNSLFRFWQRNPSGLATLTARTIVADRWIADPGTGGTIGSVAPENPALGELFGQAYTYHGQFPHNLYRHSQTTGSGGGTVPALEQRIPNVRSLANGSVVVSFFASSDTAITITPKLTQHFGDGGSASSDVVTTGTAISIPNTGVPAFYQQTIDLPSITGKTIDLSSDPDSWLEVRFEFPDATSNFVVDLWNVRVEVGTIPRPNLWLPERVDFEDCQAFYEIAQNSRLGQYFGGAGAQDGRLDAEQDITLGSGTQVYGLRADFTTAKLYDPVIRWGTLTVKDVLAYSGPAAGNIAVNRTDYTSNSSTGVPVYEAAHGLPTDTYHISAYWEAISELPIA